MDYWYLKENGALLAFEKECLIRFLREYANPNARLKFMFDKQKRFCAEFHLPFKIAPEEPWRLFKFLIVYEHNHPGRDADGMFGGSIKIYPMTKIKKGFHHMIPDSAMGAPYICQVRATDSADINGYMAMKRVLRWLKVYCVWEKTGIDLDKGK